jgi:tRNA-splicing ligase RtcB (3'-phosphate/5'-hydroxy nucleic acid ligase)
METADFEEIGPHHWRLPRKKFLSMKTDADIFASREILAAAIADESLEQVVNVASLPGIAGHSLAMADIHHGYGFCIGGVAAFPSEGGIVLPGGVGYDINCGVRLLSTAIPVADLLENAESLGYAILKRIPTGLTSKSNYHLDRRQFLRIIENGAAEIVRNYAGTEEDLAYIESEGKLEFSRPEIISPRAFQRGHSQVGSLGSGNHFIEIQAVERVFDPEAAERFGITAGTAAIMIHTGSRGFGHQIATDHIEILRRKNLSRIKVNDPQLVYAGIGSEEGKNYLQALNAASNFAWANRHLIMEDLIAIFERIFHSSRKNLGLRLVYDQAHNIAKFESHWLGSQETRLLVHRKGATRAFPPFHPDIPAAYRPVGQPVIIPGSMGTPSYLLRGTEEALRMTLGSSAHGAGRRLSRHQAIRFSADTDVREKLRRKGILVFSLSTHTLKEEIPEAYKPIDEVVESTVEAGISRRVARMTPLVVVKG